MGNKKSIKITPRVKRAVFGLVKSAVEYEKVTGRNPGITGEVGEVLVSGKLNLFLLSDRINAGFDAVSKNGKKYQIKTRRISDGKIKGRLGVVSRHRYNLAVLAILNEQYKLLEMGSMTYKKLSRLAKKHKRRNPTVREFIKNAKVVR